MQDNISKLYGALKDTYELGSEDDFRKYLSDGNNREALRKELESEYEVGDSASFTQYLGFQQAEPSREPKAYNPSEDTLGAGVGAAVLEPPADAGGTVAKKTGGNPVERAKGAKKGGYQPTWQEQMAMGITAQQAGMAAQNATAGIDQMEKNQQAYQEKSFSQSPEIGRQGHVVEDDGSYITNDATKHNVLVDANQQQQERDSYINAMRKQREEYEEPSLWDTITKSIGSGLIETGAGILNSMQQLSGGMIVEDPSSPTGYTKTQSYEEQLKDKNNAITRGLDTMHETSDRLSRQAQPRNGKGFLDLLWDGEIGAFLQKGVATAGESLPMTLSAFNPYTMVLNGISLAGNNFREQTLENPDVPAWKRAAMAIGSAAIEQAVEKYADPVFKYVGGSMIFKGAAKETTEQVVNEVTKKATENLAKRIYKRMGGLAKDAAGEGLEEVVTNVGNDALGQALDLVSGRQDYGLEAQWEKYRKQNPNATLWDFAQSKAKENIESFIAGGMAGAYTSGTSQLTVKGIEYGLGHLASQQQITANPNAQLNPVTVELAQKFDDGYSPSVDENGVIDTSGDESIMREYESKRQRATEMFGEIKGLDEKPLQTLQTMIDGLKDGTYTPEQVQAAYDYVSAKASFDGLQQRLTEERRASRPNFVVNGNNIDEVDGTGNVVATHEYDNAEDMKAGLWELQAKREHDDLMADINMLKSNPKYDWEGLINDFAAETELDVDYIESILEKDPLELEDPESAMVSEFSELVHKVLYDDGTVHEDQNAQDGATAAENMALDLDGLGGKPLGTDGAQVVEAFNAAKAARDELFAKNEDLKQEVESREAQGMPHQGIISSLDTFRPEEVQTVIDYYNAQAKMQGFMNRMGQKIDEEAANSRQRHTFKGTINGQADVRDVLTITDGVNEFYLVSGNVTTDPSTGQITGSDSGLIIGMDLDGSFVNIGDSNGYSVMPVTQTLDQFEEAERVRLQEEVTNAIDPMQTMNPDIQQAEPAGTVEQSGNLDNAGGEAVVNGDNGANNTPAAAPSPAGDSAGTVTTIPVDEKSGLKRYEQGVPVDQAIQDIQNDGFDVGEMADAYINEAQEAIDKINKKAAKKPQDLIERKKLTDVVDYYNNVKARWAEVNAEAVPQPTENPTNSEENVNVQPEQPIVEEKPVSSQAETPAVKPRGTLSVEEQKQQRIAEAKAKYGELFDDDFTKANDVFELVSMWIGRNRNLAWTDVNGKRGLQKELGWTRKIGKKDSDTKYIETLLAKSGEGVGVDEFVHMVWESPENDVMGEKRWTTEEIKEALLDILKSAQSKSDVVDYALNTRIAAAEAALQEQQKQAEAETAQQAEVEPLTDEEIQAMEANLPFAKPVEGEDIPDSPIVQLEKAISELQQQEGMPQIKLVDTDRMSDDEWYDIASNMYGGAFVSQEDIDDVRNTILADGVYVNPETGAITVYSDSQTAEEVKYKVEQINDILNGRSNEEETGRLEAEDVQRPEEGTGSAQEPEAPAAETGNGSESPRSSEQVDEYLQPRNAEEEQIIANVIAQLQQEISKAVDEQNKARSELEKATARESERATDMFGNDNALNQPGQLFDNSDMPIDNSVEGVERRTAAEREKLQEATNKLNQLQSLQERNSRIRGALDNYRRQTTIETEPTANPMEAIEHAAQQFRQEQEDKKAYGANNKLVTQDRYEDLKKRMKQKLLGQLNSGFDPEILQIGAEMAMFHIEAGARKFADYATRMINDLGDAVRPYLQSFYEAARRMPGMEQLRKEMDSTEFVDNFDVLSYDKQNDNTVNVNKQENNEGKNDVSLQQKASEEVGRKAEDADKYRAFSQAVADDMLKAMETGEKPYKSIKDIRAKAKSVGLEVDDDGRTDILLQELVEDGLVSAARQYVNTYMVNEMLAGRKADEIRNSRALFEDIVKLYNLQPSITQRSSNRIKMQQYSTPLPMSFIADVFAFREGMQDVLEPTAGNGMMVFAVPEFTVHANELDDTRLDNLRAQKFKKVTDQDATQPFEGEQYDAIIANPPFGAAPAKEYDGKEISGLAEQIALNALSKMKDDGKAAIIIGGNMEYGPNGAIKSNKAFFTYLYDHYNVKGVIDMDGKLYQKQGTTYPTRMILIDGRRSEEERAQSKVYPPTIAKAVGMKANTFEELYDIAERIKNDNNKTNGNEILRTSTGIALPDTGDTSGNTDRAGRGEQSRQNEPDGRRTERGGSNGGSQTATNRQTQGTRGRHVVGVQQPGIPGLFDSQETASEPQPQTGASGERGSVSDNGRNGFADVQGSGTSNSGVGLNTPENPKETPKQNIEQAPAEPVKPKVEEKRELDTDKLSYRPHNTAFSLESVAPAAMVEAMDANLSKIEKEHGNIDAWVTKELGYDTVDEMHNALAAEQVDSVAMAIYQMQHGQGMIIGDQTGVGKGRQMAALIRWASKQGKKPIFITQKDDLFSDIYRDLVDIGSGDLRPFIFNAASVSTDKETGEKKHMGGVMIDGNGTLVYRSLGKQAQDKIFESGKLPSEYDYVVLTYSQVNTGDQISQEEAKEAAKKSGERYQKKKKKDDKPKATPKATFLRALAKDNYMFLDESHTAAGKSNTGFYFQSILKTAKAVTFASATFAKRPDTMPMYALRTAMSKAKVKAEELIKIIENGGVTLQEIMSRALTQAGQMVRRERDMSDVKTDWKTVDDPETVKKARQNYDSTIEAFNAIIDFQKNWVGPHLDNLSRDLADVAASAGMRQGTEDLGISNVPFASKTYNYTKQLMLALKVDAIVDEVVKEIEAGRHPVIALENTMGSLLSEYAPGDVIEDTTFAASLLKGLKGVLRYTIKDEDGKEQQMELSPSQLGPDGEAAYHEVEDLIRQSTSGIFISPLDAITEKLQAKGYKVGELTGRNEMAVLDEKTGEYRVQRRTDKDKKKLARDFNSGALDVLILNKTASTGISLHASEKFSDQRQRTMIIAQPLADINDYMQMIGRIDRTGQVARGYYINLGLPVPAEGRFLMMLSTKLKSLNANTTTSQENESNDVEAPDLLNKYGSRVVVEYLRDNPDIYVKLGEPLKKDKGRVSVQELDSYEAQEDDARKITGYVALLPTAEQDAFYNDVVRRYNELIKYLNDTGSNDLKISVLPLRARTIEKQVSSEGSDPKGDNPFAGHAYVEWVEMDVLKKPMKAAEVGKVIEQLNPEVEAPKVQAKTAAQEKMLNQRMTPRVRQILDTVEKEYQAKLDKEETRYEEAKAKAEEAIKEQTEKINNSKRTPEQKKEAIEKYKSDRMQAVEETHNNMVNKIEASHDRIARPLHDFQVGDSYLVPDDLTTDAFFGASPAIFCGFKAKDEGITPSTTLAVFCTLDGRRKIEVKLSDWGPLARIKNHTEQNWDAAHDVTLSNWDSQVSNETRKHGFIMTGNILQAFADSGDNGRVPGQLVTYTDIDGNVHDGILMNQHWDPSKLKGSTVPVKSRMDEIKSLPNGDHVTSADGNVVIERLYRIYTVTVPKSKKVGGQYYENERLLDLVDGRNFYPFRGNLRGDVEAENIEEVVNVLSDLGVQMKSDTQVQFDTETEMGQAMASGRFNNSQRTLSRNAKTDESDEKAVPLERRTMKSYTDKDGNYHRGIEEEISGLEDRISRAGNEGSAVLRGGNAGNETVQQVNDLRKQAAKLRTEKGRRDQNKQELRDKYNISEKGDISLDDLSRMFHDLNSNKILGKLFDKVVSVLKNLGVEYRFTDELDANVGGRATAFINVTFYNWDTQLRNLDNQEKAKVLLHELIHNVSSQILFRYERPELGELTATQKKLAKQINDIYQAVKAFNPVRENGKPLYGLVDVHEMIAELANPEFRAILDTIPYRGSTIWQQIKNWFKRLIPGLSEDTAFESLSKALDDLLDTYDERENAIYRQQRAGYEQKMRNMGYYGNYVDFWESDVNSVGIPSIVEDAEEIARLEGEPTEKGYRTVVQNPDGTFGSPMASRLGGKKGEKSKATSPYKMNQWEQSEENPQLATDNGKINLIKPGGLGTVGNVDYNPYIHIRENKLNKQFKNAWERPDLVYIEVEYPKSELTSGYKAEKAAKTVGRHKWPGGDLILSRWDKPVRIVPWEEVANDWEKEFGKRGVEFDIVSPHLLPILAERGVEILPPHKNMGEECQQAYKKFKAEQDADPLNAIRMAARQFSKKQVDDADPLEAIRRSADSFHRESNINNPSNPLAYSAKEIYNERLNRVETVFSEAYQDAMVSLKTAQNAIAQDKDIPDSQNAYMAENLMHGKNKNEQDLYNKMFRDPLIATINKIMNLTGMNWGDVDRYVYTKSGLERNRELFVRDWLEQQRKTLPHSYEDLNSEERDIYDGMAERIEEDFEDGLIANEEEKQKKLDKALQAAHQQYINYIEEGWNSVKERNYIDLKNGDINYADYLNAMSDFIFNNIDSDYIPEEHDYSGFRAMYGDENGEYDEEAIIEELMETEDAINGEPDGESSGTVAELWEQINNATRYGLERYREAGMRSDEQIDRVEQMFNFYVPMRGFKDDTGEDMYQYFTGKDKAKSYVGGLLKHAKGRGSEANYPISTIFAMSYKAISDCNQNLVNQKFYRLCQANPNDLVILSDSWAVLNGNTGMWEESSPEIPDDASEEEVREITLAWEDGMRQMSSDGKAKKIRGKGHFDYKPMDKKNQSEHIVEVSINGDKKQMIIVGNPRAAQALNGQLRFEHGKNIFSRWNSAIKNLMSSLFTSYSPTFALRNMFRDWTHFRTMLGVREGHGYASAANKYYRQSLFKMVSLFKKYREGNLDDSKEIERDFKEFMDEGGITGYVFMHKIDDIQKEMEGIIKKQKAGKTIRLNNRLWDLTLGAIEAVNEGIENNARFATYRASRHYAGRTRARSAYDAKEITVNFNRKGAGSKTAGFKSRTAGETSVHSKAVEDAAKAFGVTSQILGEGRIFFNATVQAIATTFKNFQNSDGSLNKKYIAKWTAKYALPPFMLGLLLPAINKALANAFGGDDDDDPYANLPEWTRRKNLCFYVGKWGGDDYFITIPVGQELAAFLALGDMYAGMTYAPDLKPVDKSFGDEMVGIMNTFSPVDVDTKITKGGLKEDPISEVTGRTFSVLAPLVAVEQNLGWTGRPIYREDRFPNDQYTPEYQMVYSGTNPVLVNASKQLHELGGGDDVKRGSMEVNPAIVQYLWEQYTGGPGKVFSNTISIGKDAKDLLTGEDNDFNIRKVEGLKAFVQQGDDRTAYYRAQAKYRKYLEDAKKLKDAVNGYKQFADTDPLALTKLEQLSKSEDYVRMQIVLEAEKQLSKINKAANKADGKERKELRREYNQQMKEVVKMLDGVGE